MAQYRTQQKALLLQCLQAHRSRALRIEEIVAALSAECEHPPGKSTVYRLVNRLTAEGTVKRFEDPESHAAMYQLTGGEACHHHLHLKCLQCGRLLHMDHEESERIIGGIIDKNGFAVSQEDTTLFGTCGACRGREASCGADCGQADPCADPDTKTSV